MEQLHVLEQILATGIHVIVDGNKRSLIKFLCPLRHTSTCTYYSSKLSTKIQQTVHYYQLIASHIFSSV